MRILVCGGRDYSGKTAMNFILSNITDPHHGGKIFNNWELICGMARGADKLAYEYAVANGIKVHCFPADWVNDGRSAGYIRNKQMLDEGKPDLVIAFPGGVGTKMMVKLAREAGVEVQEIDSI